MPFCRENYLRCLYCCWKVFTHICEAGLDRKIAFQGRPASYGGLLQTSKICRTWSQDLHGEMYLAIRNCHHGLFPLILVQSNESESGGGLTNERTGNWSCDLRANEGPAIYSELQELWTNTTQDLSLRGY